MKTYRNPIISGFHPDPSVTRACDDYYLVNSSFQWFPGIPIFTSKNLIDWHPVGYALTRDEQLDVRNTDCSMGIWAPDISYLDGVFYIVYTDMRRYNPKDRTDKLIENKLIFASDPAGPWSEPVVLNGNGIDPSLFRDDDRRTYLVNQFYGPDTYSKGIICQEIDLENRQLIGEGRILWPGTDAGYTEGPHLYKINGAYYLLTAEGGTFENHQCTVARSDTLWGPYETHPNGAILTMKHSWRQTGISRSGHGDFIEVPGKGWYIAFLAARPNNGEYANLGRETFLLPMQWDKNGWPVVNGGNNAVFECPFPPLPEDEPYQPPEREEFNDPLSFEWNFCRNPEPAGYSLDERPGWLRLRGCRYDLFDVAHTNLAARRQLHIAYSASTYVECNPADENMGGGLTCYYDTREYYKLEITRTGNRKVIRLIRHRTDPDDRETVIDDILAEEPIDDCGTILKVEADGLVYRFYAGKDETCLKPIGDAVDSSILSDEWVGKFGWGFTGAFVGVYAVDRSGAGSPVDFKWFSYTGIKQ